MKVTQAQKLLQIHLRELGIKTVKEYTFAPPRRWRFDLADLENHLAFECDGGMFHGGHKRGKALEGDYEKQNTAALAGWRLLRFTNRQVLNGEARKWLKENL